MEYIVILCLIVAIVILFISIASYLKIRNNLHSEVYASNKYNIVSNTYSTLMVFFLVAYIIFLLYWIRHPIHEDIMWIVFGLLFFGSIFVGLSVLVLKQSLDATMNVKLHEVDTMTGLMTKNSFEMQAQKILNEGNGIYSLSVLDMDKFKKINDIHGHNKGDEIIRATAEIIRETVRSIDMVGRFGGDEFLILFNGIQESQVHLIMKRIEQAILLQQKKLSCETQGGLSYGVSSFNGGCGQTYQEIFEQADRNLYEMKKEKSK